ncbi:MAG: RNA methyltransferase [Candidatus Omnitrophota bacterium]|jgi:hypothetical protein|nr:MAG: RNA methyltransferase [Candidatus Omnitrophota bacterium]
MSAPLYVALLHYPVYKKDGTVITTSITPMDLHDIARSCLTFGVRRYFVVNPLPTMQYLSRRVAEFWLSDYGANYNRTRTDAFSIMRLQSQVEDCIAEIIDEHGMKPRLIGTSAKRWDHSVSYSFLADQMQQDAAPYLLFLGTGYGLINEFLRRCDHILDPITGAGEYNHLSVRSAAAIILDRLFNNPKNG